MRKVLIDYSRVDPKRYVGEKSGWVSGYITWAEFTDAMDYTNHPTWAAKMMKKHPQLRLIDVNGPRLIASVRARATANGYIYSPYIAAGDTVVSRVYR